MKVGGTREKLIESAIRLFAKQGFDATSVGEIEASSGLSPRAGGYYRHFQSKAAILTEILEGRLVETPRTLGVETLLPLGDTRSELLLLARAYLRINAENQQLARIIERELDRDERVLRSLTRANEALFESLSAWLATKKAGAGADVQSLRAAVGLVFGSWLFVLTKHTQQTLPASFDVEFYLGRWATFWAAHLDGPGGDAVLFD